MMYYYSLALALPCDLSMKPFLVAFLISVFAAFPSPSLGQLPPLINQTMATECASKPYTCGDDNRSLIFPFWGNGASDYCGHPGFELRCVSENYPLKNYSLIDIDGIDFRVLRVDQENHTMTLARNDLWESPCSPTPRSAALNRSFFAYPPTVENLTLLHNCSSEIDGRLIDSFPNSYRCPGEDDRRLLYMNDSFLNSVSDELEECGDRIYRVPVSRDALDRIELLGRDYLIGGLREGFQVNYMDFIRCYQCSASNGSCGFDEDAQFQCSCREGFELVDSGSFCERRHDPRYKACEPRSCGTGPSISYPFWLSNAQQPFCGYPNFKVTCGGENPVLRISNDDYVVKEIFYSNRSFIVANANVYNEQCPVPQRNISLDGTPFGFSSRGVDLSFFYNCTTVPSTYALPFSIDCFSNQTHRSFATFHEAALKHVNYSTASCRSLVSVPADAASNVEFERLLGMNYAEILKMGFLLNWTAYSCTGCRASGGRCGFIDTEFACFCGDRPHKRTCHDGRDWTMKIIFGVAGSVCGVAIMGALFYFCKWHKKRRESASVLLSRNISSDVSSSAKDVEKGGSTYLGIRIFTYEELAHATNNFDHSKELGDGGFGTVYHGKLKDGRAVAVKRLYENNYRRVEQFMNEVEILAHVRHQNLVSLYGCTSRHCRELLLVYEYIPNGTVADHLHGPRARPGGLPWPARLSVALDTAAALAYLHRSDIIHRDVKTNNILLDSHFRVKVADFGLSRLFPTHVTHVSTAPQGTPGYVDPEYHQCYQLTSKSDVFSFGVVLVELISSMPAVDITRHRHDINLSTMAVNRIQNHALHELVDPSLGFGDDPAVRREVTAVAELAFRCLQQEKDMRPSMDDVLEELKAIQNRDYGAAENAVVGSADDAAVLLKNGSLTMSPDSVTIGWDSSKTTTPGASK